MKGRAGQMDVATDTYHNKEDGKYYGLFNNQPKTKDQLYEFYLHIIKEFRSSFWKTRSTRTIMTRPRH